MPRGTLSGVIRILLTSVTTIRDPLFAQPFARWCTVAATALLAGAWIAIAAIPHVAWEESIVVHYTTTFGIDALGRWTDLLRIPTTGTVLLAVNLGAARFLARPAIGDPLSVSDRRTDREELGPALPTASRVLVAASVAIEIAVLIASVLLWRVNA